MGISNRSIESGTKLKINCFLLLEFFLKFVFLFLVQDQNQQIKLSASKSVHISRLGWQKMDVTSTVSEWYANGSKTRLRFLVDCSGCVNRIKIHLFNGKSSENSKARAKPNLLHTGKDRIIY